MFRYIILLFCRNWDFVAEALA